MKARSARSTSISWILLLFSGLGCSAPPAEDQVVTTAAREASAPELDAEDPALLPRPFSAEEIRDEWTEGFRVVVRRSAPDGEVLERWTVVAADEDGVGIESATLDSEGGVVGEPRVRRSTWVELRDHASFPAASASREWTSRSTALGELEGWLYLVTDEAQGTTSELFFAASLPGAPVLMRVRRGEATVAELEQVERYRP